MESLSHSLSPPLPPPNKRITDKTLIAWYCYSSMLEVNSPTPKNCNFSRDQTIDVIAKEYRPIDL